MKCIAIMGMGLMGTSLGLALKARGYEGRIRGYARRQETCDAALDVGAVDDISTHPADAVLGADVVVLCVPILSMSSLLKQCASALKAGCVVTDVGSTKQSLAVELPPLLADTGAVFVGSHPVCGSEQRGVDAGDANLYQGAVVVLTPDTASTVESVDTLARLWRLSGAYTRKMSPGSHDRMLARTSHLPHMVAVILALSVARGDEDASAFCGTGFRDTTRIAEGSPELWHDIAYSNSASLRDELVAFRSNLDEFIAVLERSDYDSLKGLLEAGAEARHGLVRDADQGEDA